MNTDRLVLGSIGITPVGRVQRGWAIKVSINLRVINAPRLSMKPRVARTMIGEDGNRAVLRLDVIEKISRPITPLRHQAPHPPFCQTTCIVRFPARKLVGSFAHRCVKTPQRPIIRENYTCASR